MTFVRWKALQLVALAFVVAECASIGVARAGAISVEDAWARRAPMMSNAGHSEMAGNGAVYAVIKNSGTTPDALVSATSNVAGKVELHEAKNGGGIMAMRPVDKIDVPAGGEVQLKPGGYHVMLLGLRRDLKPGDTIPVTLNFQTAGTVTVEATVR